MSDESGRSECAEPRPVDEQSLRKSERKASREGAIADLDRWLKPMDALSESA